VKEFFMRQECEKKIEDAIASEYPNTTGIVVLHDGLLEYEHYFNGYSAKDTSHIFSVTKSVVSALFGIAIDEGYIKSVKEPVLDFFPDYKMKRGEKMIQTVTIEHLLTMTAPYKCRREPYIKFFKSENWMRTALDLLGGKKSPGAFFYSPIVGTHILSGILSSATKTSMRSFAEKHLFASLGISVPKDIVFHDKAGQMAFYKEKSPIGWVADPQGYNTASWGLCLTPREMASIGQLYLSRGIWNGKQVIPSSWVEESTTIHSTWNELSYGYLWWLIDKDLHSFAALGDGGNTIYVNPTKHLVVAMTGTFIPRAKDRLDFIMSNIEPAFD
jgi:CubicO group peptidase (beta-lactamase class C family)